MIVGGGIGGLATGLALTRRGWHVEVCERAPEFTEIGAGLSLWPNALHALAALDLDRRVRELGAAESWGGVRDRAGRWLSRTDNAELERRFGMPLVVLHRADLVRALADALPPSTLRPSATVTGIRDDGAKVVVELGDDTRRVDLVVGADGAHSTVRRLRWPDAEPPRYAGYTAWRMITDPIPPHRVGDSAAIWGRGERFGYTALTGDRFYCFATATVPPGGSAPGGEKHELIRRFGRWAAPIPDLLAAVPEERVLRHDIHDLLPLDGYARGRIALLGDAAHAMTPNLGQGACQALEDAVVLADCLDRIPGVEAALARYDRERRPRTRMIARRSARFGAIGQLAWPPAAWGRDLAARLTPEALTLRSMAPILGWRP